MQERLRSALKWIAGAAAAGIIGAVAVVFGHDFYCALRPPFGWVECAVTDDKQANEADEKRKTAERQLEQIAQKAKQANENLETAETRRVGAEQARGATAEKLRAAKAKLGSLDERLECNPVEPSGGEQLKRALAEAQTDVERTKQWRSDLALRVRCLGLQIAEMERWSDHASLLNPGLGQRLAGDDCSPVHMTERLSPSDMGSLIMRKREAEAQLERASTALPAASKRVRDSQSALDNHNLAVAEAQRCAQAKDQTAEVEAPAVRAARDEARAAIGDLSDDLAAAEGQLVEADKARARAKELVDGLTREKEQACQDLTQATATLRRLDRLESADKGEDVAGKHGC